MGNTSTAVEESEFVEESNTVGEPKIAYKTVWYCTRLYGTVQDCIVLYKTVWSLLFTLAVPRLKSVF